MPDILKPDLNVVFCGINPGLYSAAVGHHFAHPSNRFWRVLHLSGFTPWRLDPKEDETLPDFGLGLTNLVARPSASASELTASELVHGREQLEEKLGVFRPGTVAFLGLGAFRTAFQQRDSLVGHQPDRIAQAQVWLLPNPSGLNASYSLQDLVSLFIVLQDASQPGT